ncbi:Uncharacterised protein [Candidatus Ornithobacterium hominis]|uniref:Outer membrane protein beta-barrel domain-containing protein n=1 Tax=Candidatus Ornithobacterium hominis TaxID=2497989 RepID=A0A383U5C3_9FLAO|nr:DUF3575 domain-containing protein [Candidatus Ornithobacterium hominis]SZD74153.1 Uncharacterised protein [Candidatus Ornithobacterium hominis]
MNLKKLVSASVILFSVAFSFGQEQSLQSLGKVSVNLTSLSIDYQFPISESWVMEPKVGIAPAHQISDGKMELGYQYNSIFIANEFRYLYSFAKRAKLGRDTKLNSASYFGLKTRYNFGAFNNQPNTSYGNTLNLAGVWGLQRNLDSNFLLNFHAGLGWVRDFDFKKSAVYPEFGIGFSYVLFK